MTNNFKPTVLSGITFSLQTLQAASDSDCWVRSELGAGCCWAYQPNQNLAGYLDISRSTQYLDQPFDCQLETTNPGDQGLPIQI